MKAPEELSFREAADRIGVTLGALQRALAGGSLAPSTGAAPAPPPQRLVPVVRKPARVAPAQPVTSAYAPPAVAVGGAPVPIPPKADLREELIDLLGQTKAMVADAMRKGRGFASLGQLVDKIAARIQAIDLSRQDHGSEVAQVLAAGPRAVAKIRQGCVTVAAREVEVGACARCGAGLSADVIVRRRTEAGLDQPAPH